MQKIIDKLLENSVNDIDTLKKQIIDNPTFIVESVDGNINFLFLNYKGLNEIKRLYMYSDTKLKPCRVKEFIRKIELGIYKIIYEVV